MNDLREYEDLNWVEYQNDKLLRRFIERTLHLAIESCLDIGSHIISDERLGVADTNADIMNILAENGIIKEEIDDYIKMAKFRNVIVHDYTTLEDEVIFNILTKNLEQIERLFYWFKEYIE
nr:DUF86 domain-containing protein [Acetohalobium arabaticum]